MSSDVQTLIVGAGPTGLTLACELARRGAPFRLIEGMQGPAVGSRAKGMQPRTLEVFDNLGVVDEALAGGRFHLGFRFYDGQGGYQDADLHEGREPRPDAPYPSTLVIPQWRTEGILRRLLESLGGKVEYGASLIDCAQDEAGVTARISRGDQVETFRTGFLVGCDGGHSAARRAAGVSFIGETNEERRMLVGDFHAFGLDRDHWHAWRNEHGFLALAPLPASEIFQFQASLPPEAPADASLARFQAIVDTRTGRSDIRLSEMTWASLWRSNVRMVDRYRVGRVLLAGDAAHVHSPAGAQGMNTGIQDAANLGWKLAAVAAGADAALLDTYEEERLPIAAWVLGVSADLTGRSFRPQSTFERRDEATLQLLFNYRGRRLARELRVDPGRIQAGDRAPDAPGLRTANGTRRLFDVFRGPQFTLLGFGAGWDPMIGLVENRFPSLVRSIAIGEANATASSPVARDAEGHAARSYDIARDTLMLVRPDGYIGVATEERSAAPIIAYLETIAG
jgi:2-polyprenyl-6-methoxyphenol hydroxylase-like FAD-dependent oxidoreductase